jgi:hypothetical protein
VQIGGGVRVGDAFQVIVGPRPVAIRVTENCVQICRTRPSRLDGDKERERTGDGKREDGVKARAGKLYGLNEYGSVTGINRTRLKGKFKRMTLGASNRDKGGEVR